MWMIRLALIGLPPLGSVFCLAPIEGTSNLFEKGPAEAHLAVCLQGSHCLYGSQHGLYGSQHELCMSKRLCVQNPSVSWLRYLH